MYLKEISSTGFKSFAEKLTITLDGKTTCIVGPNGSGKSNIVDAVRWVLGEQSVKSLRGNDTMTDVIFSGSKSRNPLNVASVSLIFDNSDNYLSTPYNEVSIKRRVYRSGENEYFINGEKCRLKDITDLLIDSAVGKESFNIISQGEIQKILSNSPSERRSIFESAAGVLKYKKRKEEALRKLDRTNNNLDRVLDIITELEVQVEPLKEQSKKAMEYLEAKDKLDNIEVAYIVYLIDTINYEYSKAKEKIEKLNIEILNMNVKGSSNDTDLINEKNKLNSFNEKLKSLNGELLELTRLEERLNGEKNILKERSKYSAEDVKVHENISRLKEELLQNENGIHIANKELEILNNDLLVREVIVRDREVALSILKNKRLVAINELNSLTKEKLETEHKSELLRNYIESGGSVSGSVKSILNNPRLRGIHDILGNLVDVEDIYIKALEVAIQSTKQFIIVDDESAAKKAIEYLKDNNLGRATFFPISVIKPRGIEPGVLGTVEKDDGYIGVFSSLVKYDSKYYNIIANQLGNVIIAKDIDVANRIAKSINYRYKVVSVFGDVINVGGSITGGSVSISKSIITEKKELEQLNRKISELGQVILDLNSSIQAIDKELVSSEEEHYKERTYILDLNEKMSAKKSLISIITSRLSEIKNELSSLEHVVDSSLSSEEEKITNEYYEALRRKEVLIKDIEVIVRDRDNLVVMLDEMDAVNRLNNSELFKLEKELKSLEINISKMEFKLDDYLKTLSEEYELTYEKAKANYILEIDPDIAGSEVSKYKSLIKSIGMVNVDSIEDYKRVSERYDFLSSQRNDLLNAKDTLIEIIDEMDAVMEDEFLITFEKIQIEFKKVFKELFGGGNADLKLTDPNNVLETGIEIVASPPGKTLKSITLLSGGEMTLTAISLIFAILNIRSVPFCIFDEVEAALDEANVDNFGKYLNHYKDKTQFLIITHKKKTMEYADTLYGITMQESGVSKLVSVKLDKIIN